MKDDEAPATEGTTVAEGELTIALVVEGEVVSGVTGGGGLRPPGTSSVEPIGIPTRPTVASAPMPVGDEAEAAGAEAAPPLAMQVPDALPALVPASNSAVGSAMPVVRAAAPPHAALLPVIALCGTLVAIVGLTPGDVISVAP